MCQYLKSAVLFLRKTEGIGEDRGNIPTVHVTGKKNSQKDFSSKLIEISTIPYSVPNRKQVQNHDLYKVDCGYAMQLFTMPEIQRRVLPGNTNIGNLQMVLADDFHQRVKHDWEHMIMRMTIEPNTGILRQELFHGKNLGANLFF